MAESGIYEIVNRVNGKRYIGSTSSFERRWKQHISGLTRGRHHSLRLQRAWEKYGRSAFEFLVVEVCEDSALLQREQHFIDLLKPAYNASRLAVGGAPMSTAGKAKIAESNRRRSGWKMSAESRARLSASKIGNQHTKGKPRSRAAVAKTAAAHRGMKRSAETCAKISAKAKGRKFTRSAEYRAKLSERQKGRSKSREHMMALQDGRKRRVYTDEQRAAISAKLKEHYADGTRTREKSAGWRSKISETLKRRAASLKG